MTNESELDDPHTHHLPVLGSNRELTERAQRLREAVREAGGNQVAAKLSRIPVSTLNRYLAGQEMRASALISLAAACRVSLDWLATGIGPRNPEAQPHMSGPDVGTNLPDGGQVVQGPSQPLVQRPEVEQAEDPRRIMFTEANVKELTEALDAADAVIEVRGAEPETRVRVQLMLLLRDYTYKARHDKDGSSEGG